MSQSPVRVVGVDGGATRIRCVLADEEGRTLAQSEGGAGLLGAGEDRAVADRILEQARYLASESGASLPIDALCAGLAGVAGGPAAREYVELRVREAAVARSVLIAPDYEVAFLDAFGHGGGILIIAGTGSVAVGRSGEDPLVRVGGWGSLIGDEGSGYRVGLRGVRAAIRAAEDRNPPSSLTESLFGALSVESAREVFEWSKGVTKAEVAALAPRVIEEADRGDEVACQIAARAVEELVQHAEGLARTVSLVEHPAVALVGGLVEPGGLLRDRVVLALERAGFRMILDRVSPVRGAVRLALER